MLGAWASLPLAPAARPTPQHVVVPRRGEGRQRPGRGGVAWCLLGRGVNGDTQKGASSLEAPKLGNASGIKSPFASAFLRHRSTQNTTRYTALAPDRFKGFALC